MEEQLKQLVYVARGVAANIFYGFPARKIPTIIGVTGTDGKTTTATAIYHVLKAAGYKAALITTVAAYIGNEEIDTGLHTTTPNALILQKLLRRCVREGCTHVVLEVTSHAIHQKRILGIPFAISVLTNITPEHLDYHKTFAAYVRVKTQLLIAAKTAIINKDHDSFTHVKKLMDEARHPFLTYGLKDADFVYDFKKVLPDIASYNAYNFLAAYSVCRQLSLPEEVIIKALTTVKLPKGRLDVIKKGERTVVIDFAHTPNALKELFMYLTATYPNLPITHVFGCAGERDRDKRAVMGHVSDTYAHAIVITEEDYRSEDVNAIAADIQKGIEHKEKVHVIQDRQEAIRFAIRNFKGLIVITGKGHEQSLARGNEEHPWSEHEAVINALRMV